MSRSWFWPYWCCTTDQCPSHLNFVIKLCKSFQDILKKKYCSKHVAYTVYSNWHGYGYTHGFHTGLGHGSGSRYIFFTQKKPTPEKYTHHLCLYPCIIWVILNHSNLWSLFTLGLSNCFFILFLISVSHCDMTKQRTSHLTHSYLQPSQIHGKSWQHTLWTHHLLLSRY